MAWSGRKCAQVRSIASTGPMLLADIQQTKDVRKPVFRNVLNTVGVRGNYPDSLRRRFPIGRNHRGCREELRGLSGPQNGTPLFLRGERCVVSSTYQGAGKRRLKTRSQATRITITYD